MKTFYKVLLPFINRDDMKEYNRGGKVALTPDRAKYLRELKVIGDELATEPPPPEDGAAVVSIETGNTPPPPEDGEAVLVAETAESFPAPENAVSVKGKLIMPKGKSGR
jgi:hypothetical protein